LIFICKFCNKKTSKRYNLVRHEKSCKLNPDRIDLTVICPECGKKCSNNQNLTQHLTMSHSPEASNRKIKCAKSYKVYKDIITLDDISSRTKSKILERMNLGCSRCGWAKSTGDFHHIVPRSKGGDNSHSNLTYLCPNCHRLAHTNKLDEFITFEEQVKDKWKEYYYSK